MLALKKSDRVAQMKAEFMNYYNRNWTIERIALRFSVSKPTISRYLEEIAQANGLSRKEMINHFRELNKTNNYC